MPVQTSVLVTHTHWDHIQGFPFFVPSFVPGFAIDVYAPPNIDTDIESIFRGQLDRAYFPVQMEDMQAKFEFKVLGDFLLILNAVHAAGGSVDELFHPLSDRLVDKSHRAKGADLPSQFGI